MRGAGFGQFSSTGCLARKGYIDIGLSSRVHGLGFRLYRASGHVFAVPTSQLTPLSLSRNSSRVRSNYIREGK